MAEIALRCGGSATRTRRQRSLRNILSRWRLCLRKRRKPKRPRKPRQNSNTRVTTSRLRAIPLTIKVDGGDYTPLWDGIEPPEAWIKGHLEAQLRSRLEFKMRNQELTNKATGWEPKLVSG